MFEFKLDEQMTMIIVEALGEFKLRLAGPVVAELQRQINVQRRANGQMPLKQEGDRDITQ